MKEAYKEAMNHIAVTEEMRVRILANIQNADLRAEKGGARSLPVRYFAVAACFALLIAGAIALPDSRPPAQSEDPSGVQSGVLDRTEADSLQALSRLVGFEVRGLPDLPFDVAETKYAAYGQTLAEVTYIGQTQTLVFRKTPGAADPSGDYTAYSDTLILEIGGLSVTLKGDAGAYRLAVWQDDVYACSISASAPFSDTEWLKILATTGSDPD